MGVVSDKEVVFDEGSKYVTVFDPLDGSSNVDAGIPTGTYIIINKYQSSLLLMLQ